jgi:sulfate permease, SulP family
VRSQKRHLLISGCSRNIYRILKKSDVLEILQADCDPEKGETNIFPELASNPNLATRNALKRAQQILGTDKAEIHIYVDTKK